MNNLLPTAPPMLPPPAFNPAVGQPNILSRIGSFAYGIIFGLGKLIVNHPILASCVGIGVFFWVRRNPSHNPRELRGPVFGNVDPGREGPRTHAVRHSPSEESSSDEDDTRGGGSSTEFVHRAERPPPETIFVRHEKSHPPQLTDLEHSPPHSSSPPHTPSGRHDRGVSSANPRRVRRHSPPLSPPLSFPGTGLNGDLASHFNSEPLSDGIDLGLGLGPREVIEHPRKIERAHRQMSSFPSVHQQTREEHQEETKAQPRSQVHLDATERAQRGPALEQTTPNLSDVSHSAKAQPRSQVHLDATDRAHREPTLQQTRSYASAVSHSAKATGQGGHLDMTGRPARRRRK